MGKRKKRAQGEVPTRKVVTTLERRSSGRPSRSPAGIPATERSSTRKEAKMPHIDIDVLTPFAAKFMEGTNLTPAERSEVLRMAQGFACKDSAAAAGVSPETIRARRKRIYRKLDVPGSSELISALLALVAADAREGRAHRAERSTGRAAAADGRLDDCDPRPLIDILVVGAGPPGGVAPRLLPVLEREREREFSRRHSPHASTRPLRRFRPSPRPRLRSCDEALSPARDVLLRR